MAITHQDGSITHVGQVVSIGSTWHSSMDITTYSAEVWVNGKFEAVYLSSDQGGPARATAKIDATPQVLAEVKAHKDAMRQKAQAERDAKEAQTVRKGKTVKVVKGRKVPRGTEGHVFWMGEGQWGTRVGIKDAQGTVHWTALSNVQVI